mmetsp:Transcript_12982/g.29452  ORF Transcript_12982/g.29452 Transcript_12982/m.29452 type:complete len:265 (-) Transcript_12982:70-864(-)
MCVCRKSCGRDNASSLAAAERAALLAASVAATSASAFSSRDCEILRSGSRKSSCGLPIISAVLLGMPAAASGPSASTSLRSTDEAISLLPLLELEDSAAWASSSLKCFLAAARTAAAARRTSMATLLSSGCENVSRILRCSSTLASNQQEPIGEPHSKPSDSPTCRRCSSKAKAPCILRHSQAGNTKFSSMCRRATARDSSFSNANRTASSRASLGTAAHCECVTCCKVASSGDLWPAQAVLGLNRFRSPPTRVDCAAETAANI